MSFRLLVISPPFVPARNISKALASLLSQTSTAVQLCHSYSGHTGWLFTCWSPSKSKDLYMILP